MNKDPVIERMIAVNELTEILCGKPCDICKFYGQHSKCMPVYTAEKIVDAGWRKASEVADEIFDAVDEMMNCVTAMTGYALTYYGSYPEIKNKYKEIKK